VVGLVAGVVRSVCRSRIWRRRGRAWRGGVGRRLPGSDWPVVAGPADPWRAPILAGPAGLWLRRTGRF